MPVYLYLNLFTIFFPLILSFDKRVQFYRNWPFLFPAIAVNALIFIAWDSYFTRLGVWGFNPDYLLGLYWLGLPLEEILFFITVPYACVFIYETLNTYFPHDYLRPYATGLSVALVMVLIPVGIIFWPRLYTSVTFFALSMMQLVHYWMLKTRVLGRFYLAYFVHLIPFLVINGVLTALPVVWYNNHYNLGIRLITIPLEDTMYAMLMLLLTISVYEWLRKRKYKQKNTLVV